jgi:hypothetical protein
MRRLRCIRCCLFCKDLDWEEEGYGSSIYDCWREGYLRRIEYGRVIILFCADE